LQDPDVLFAGYKMPHPLEQRVLLKVRTTRSTTPPTSFSKAVNALADQIAQLRGVLEDKIQEQEHFLHSQHF
jgi:DNA-directed RNA polymerase II subunit RPB11